MLINPASKAALACLPLLSYNQTNSPFLLWVLTVIAVVIHQDYLFEQVGGCPVDGRVNRPQDDRQGFVHKNEHNAHLGEVQGISNVPAPVEDK